MKNIIFVLFVAITFSFDTIENKVVLNGKVILKLSQEKHDPNNEWSTADIHWYLQEPRLQNPQRMSDVKLNNQTGEFQLIRNRDEYLSTHIIDANGEAKTLFNGKVETDEELIEKYRLQPSRNVRYRTFYQMLFGLPMSLTDDKIKRIVSTKKIVYKEQKAFKIEIELVEEIFTKYWRLYISRKDFTVLALEMIDAEGAIKGERLEFDGSVMEGTMNIHRMHHWYDMNDDTYLGSDIIIHGTEEK